jgi:hypothetical protein
MNKLIYLLIFVTTIVSAQNQDSEIFNGSNLDGWVNYGGGKFFVEDQCIVAEAINGIPNTFLHTEKKISKF